MAAGKSIRDRIRKSREESPLVRGVLPMSAFYGRDSYSEFLRNQMYASVARVMEDDSRTWGNYLFFDNGMAVTALDANSSPVEYLVSRGELETNLDPIGMARARFHTAVRLRELMDGAQVKGLRSPSLGGVGGGGVAPGAIRGYQLDCMRLMEKVKKTMGKTWMFPMLQVVVWQDDWLDLWVDRKSKKEERMKTIIALQHCLDVAAASLGYIPREDIMRRWGEKSPAVPPAVRRRILASTAPSRLALQT